MPKTFPARGFTLIELLVAISLALIIGTFGLAYYSAFNRRQIVEQTAKKIVSDIRLAQNLALAQQKPADCTDFKGYVFDVTSSSYEINPDCTPPSGTVKKINLERVVLSGMTSIEFSVMTLGVGTTGRLIVQSPDGSYHREIVVGNAGNLTIE